MAQLIWGCSFRQRNEVDAVSYHGKMPRTGDSSYYNFTQPTMQSEALMKTPSYTNLQIYRLLRPSNFQINPNISVQVEFGGFLEPISMTRAGYTTKKEFGEFLRSFGVLAPEILSENNDERFACLKLLDKLGLTNYQHSDSAWDQLKHIRQAVEFLVTQGKPEMTVEKVTKCLCPELSALQLHRISTMFWDDRHGTKSVPPEVIEMLRLKTTVGSSFLLGDDSSLPFSADEICKSGNQIFSAPIETSDSHLPPLIRDKYGCTLSSIEERINNIALIFNSA